MVVQGTGVPEELLGDVLVKQVRGDVGDIAGVTTSGFGVVLQGARPKQAGAFLGRVKNALENEAVSNSELDIQIFNSATESKRIESLLQTPGALETVT